jgi:hypothetical protein
MATSGSTSFSLSLEEIVDEAFDRCGLKLMSGEDFQTARRSLDLMLIEWQNRGTNFWTLDQTTVNLVQGQESYILADTVYDVLECFVRTGTGTSQQDLTVRRTSVSSYAKISNKPSQGRPVKYWLDKQRDAPVMYLWPVPDQAYSLIHYSLSRVEDSGSPASLTTDVPYRFLPALVAGLAYNVGIKRSNRVAPDKLMSLKADYEQQWDLAQSGDRDRSSFRIRPAIRR